MLECALENLNVYVVVVRDRSTRSAIFALYGDLSLNRIVAAFKSPDTTAKALSDTAVSVA
jgi:hypothetical protein